MAVIFCSTPIEAVRRKPLSERTQEIGFRIGLAIVLMLTMFVTWNDLASCGSWLTRNWIELRQDVADPA